MDKKDRKDLKMSDQAASFDISDVSKNGYKMLRDNKISEAIDCFSSILQVDGNNNYALVGMGDAIRKRGLCREAAVFYQRCLECHPGNNYALFGLADCYKALNQYHKAIEIWEQYLLHDDRNITVLTRVADAYRKVRDFRHSKAIYLRVLEMEEGNPYAIIGLGHLHYDFKEYHEALLYWEKMLAISPDDVDIRVLTSIGNCHRKLKTFAEGIVFFKRALQKEPSNFYAIFGLADCYRGLKQHEKSLMYWNKILEQDPRNKVILTRAGDAYRSIGRFDKAQEYYERALNIEFDTYAVLGLALIAKCQGKYDDAATSLRRLIQQDSKNYRIFVELANCCLKKGDRRQAAEVLEEFQRLGIRSSQVSEMLERL
ncbi:MAG: tetratricopeptide repeat protein [Treponema sp.]|jgi:tetratricopeptide (TPR) repeat protein|nr:tetratricopeptide repeat protein [Treponema sp.]